MAPDNSISKNVYQFFSKPYWYFLKGLCIFWLTIYPNLPGTFPINLGPLLLSNHYSPFSLSKVFHLDHHSNLNHTFNNCGVFLLSLFIFGSLYIFSYNCICSVCCPVPFRNTSIVFILYDCVHIWAIWNIQCVKSLVLPTFDELVWFNLNYISAIFSSSTGYISCHFTLVKK